jgi:hypothetical protein
MSFRWLPSTTGPKGIEARSELTNVCSGLAEQAKTIVMVEQSVTSHIFLRTPLLHSQQRITFISRKPSSRIKSRKLFDVILGPVCPPKARSLPLGCFLPSSRHRYRRTKSVRGAKPSCRNVNKLCDPIVASFSPFDIAYRLLQMSQGKVVVALRHNWLKTSLSWYIRVGFSINRER